MSYSFEKRPADTSLPANRQVKHLTQRASWAKVFEARPCQHRVDVREFAVARAAILHRFAAAFETELLLNAQRRRVVGDRAGIDGIAQAGVEHTHEEAMRGLGHVAASPIGPA